MHTSTSLTALAMLFLTGMVLSAEIRQKRESEGQYSDLKDKRPFCNAFTGCGRKRSAAPVVDEGGGKGDANYLPLPASLGPDSKAELEELARHVLAQARLWEQLQHKVELLRALASGYPASTGNTLETFPYRRRKRALHQTDKPLQKEDIEDVSEESKREGTQGDDEEE